jgi:glycerophosphoryl diester phosphodiesterase
VIAHRGRCTVAGPENTIAGAMAALDAGYDGLEVDVRRTADGALVLMHDPTPMRTTFAREADGQQVRHRPVETTSLAQLRMLGLRTPEWSTLSGWFHCSVTCCDRQYAAEESWCSTSRTLARRIWCGRASSKS